MHVPPLAAGSAAVGHAGDVAPEHADQLHKHGHEGPHLVHVVIEALAPVQENTTQRYVHHT